MPEIIEPKFILNEEVVVPNAVEDEQGDTRSEEAVVVGVLRDETRPSLIKYKLQFKDKAVQSKLFKAIYLEEEIEKK